MRRFVSVLAVAGAGLVLASCGTGERDSGSGTAGSSEGSNAGAASAGADGSASSTAVSTDNGSSSAESVTRSNGALSLSQETEDYFFEYSWPEKAGSIPGLARYLEDRLARSRAGLAEEAARARAEAEDDGFPYNKYSYGAEWQVVADTSGFISLSNAFSSYEGGAHGNYGVESLVWDKDAGRAMDGVDMFRSPAALNSALGDRLCDGLNAERIKRRGEDYVPQQGGTFDDCPGIDEGAVLVGSSNGRTFNRITIYFGPYVAGAYAEGAYELDLSMDRAMLEAVKPQYRTAFSVR